MAISFRFHIKKCKAKWTILSLDMIKIKKLFSVIDKARRSNRYSNWKLIIIALASKNAEIPV